MHTSSLLTELVAVFGIAVVVVLVFNRLKLPAIAGFIAAGSLVSPFGLGVSNDPKNIEELAEGGVVVLLFTIGLEFSLHRLRRLWKLLALGGGLQVGLTVLAVQGVSLVLGLSWQQGVFYGFLVALSSTAIVLRGLHERLEVDAPHGKMIVGALIFQDLCVVPMMLLTPMLAGNGGSLVEALLALAKAAGVVLAVLVLGRKVIPRLMRVVAASRRREVFVLAVLLVCTGVAWLTSLVGLSLALGAFLGGIALADSEYGQQALSDVLPFREALSSLFFISVGMLFDVRVVLQHPALVVGLVVGVMWGKLALASLAALVMRFPPRVAVLAGIGLAQVGEFSFVLAVVGAEAGLLSPEHRRLFVVVAVITMVATPLLLRFGPRLAAGAPLVRQLEKLLGGPGVPVAQAAGALAGHVIVAGWGVAGQLVCTALQRAGQSFLVLELNAQSCADAAAHGVPISFGDVTHLEILEHAGLKRARALIVLINDPDAARRAVSAAHQLAPKVPILVRVQYLRDGPEHLKLGATEVLVSEVEGAFEAVSRALKLTGADPENIERSVQAARDAVA